MIFDRNNTKDVVALLGAGSMGTTIVRRIGAGKKIFLGDINEEHLAKVSDDFRRSGYDVETMKVNALDKESVCNFARRANELGRVLHFIDTAEASPNQANPEHIVDLDMVGTGYAIDAFGEVIAEGGSGLVISSQAGYMYPIPNDVEVEIVRTTTEQLKQVTFINDVAMQNSGFAYMIAKRVNHLQVQRAAATSWAHRRARINSISPGIIVTPLAYDEFNANGEGYQRMIDASAARRVATSDEIAEVAAFLLGDHAKFITGIDILADGGVIAALRTGEYQLG